MEIEGYLDKELDDYRVKRYSRSIVLFNRCLHLVHDKEISYDLATMYYRKGEYQKAIKKYRLAAVIEPNSEKTYSAWGSCLSHLGRYDEAILKFKKALETNPNYGLAYLNWGLILFWQKKKDEAEKIIEEGIKRTEMKEELIMTVYKLDLSIVEAKLEKASNKEEREFLLWRIVGYNRVLALIPNVFKEKALEDYRREIVE